MLCAEEEAAERGVERSGDSKMETSRKKSPHLKLDKKTVI